MKSRINCQHRCVVSASKLALRRSLVHESFNSVPTLAQKAIGNTAPTGKPHTECDEATKVTVVELPSCNCTIKRENICRPINVLWMKNVPSITFDSDCAAYTGIIEVLCNYIIGIQYVCFTVFGKDTRANFFEAMNIFNTCTLNIMHSICRILTKSHLTLKTLNLLLISMYHCAVSTKQFW